MLSKNIALSKYGLALLFTVGLCACPPPPVLCDGGPEDPETCPAPGLPDDVCNSKEEAFGDPCLLTLGTAKEGHITTLADGGMDRDWYGVQLGTLTPRSLLHVNAGYTVPQTAVNFSVNVLKEDGTTVPICTGGQPCPSSGIDKHGAAAPKPVDLVLPFSTSNERLLVLVGDEGGSAQVRVDNRNPYRVMVEVVENPDTNEPNDTDPTQVTLTGSPIAQGTSTGYLATNDDVDKFKFDVGAGARQIIYLHVSTARALNPPTPYRLSFTLYDPDMTPIAEDHMDNEFLVVNLATAKLAPKPGTYTLVVQGYRDINTQGVIRGDTRADSMYTLDVRVMPDEDTSEPNDTLATARVRALTLNSTINLTGKLSTIPDDEWFALDMPANGATTVLRYKLTAATSGGRFPPTAPLPARQVRLSTEVTQGATTQDRQNACKNDYAVCPKGLSIDPRLQDFVPLVEAMCTLSDPPQCLWAEKNEEPLYTNLRNLEGSIPVPPHGATTRVYLVVRDIGRARLKYADDRDWTLRLSWESNPADGPTPVALSGATTNTDGVVAWGYGRVIDPFDLNRAPGIRGPNDYEASPTDLDTYQFNMPSATDQAWSVSWDLLHPDAGGPPGDLTLEVALCQGASLPDGGCGGTRKALAYSSDNLTPWYLPQSFGNATKLFDRSTSGGTTTVTLLPVGCWCIPAATAATGRILVTVGGVNRTASDPIRYRLMQSVGAYPQSYTGADGGSFACPMSDGGCGFR